MTTNQTATEVSNTASALYAAKKALKQLPSTQKEAIKAIRDQTKADRYAVQVKIKELILAVRAEKKEAARQTREAKAVARAAKKVQKLEARALATIVRAAKKEERVKAQADRKAATEVRKQQRAVKKATAIAKAIKVGPLEVQA